jgi:hypothetical protein
MLPVEVVMFWEECREGVLAEAAAADQRFIREDKFAEGER